MTVSLAYLGPAGTYTETAAIAYADWLRDRDGIEPMLCPFPSIAQVLHTLARGEVEQAVIPVENSTQGSVTMTLDALWQLDRLQIQQALVLPVAHALLSYATQVEEIRTVYSHRQALAQCQRWLESHIPEAQLIATDSTTEAVDRLAADSTAAAIASPRSATLYAVPTLASNVNDYPDNCTRFWVMGRETTTQATQGSRLSFACSLPDQPGALAKILTILADRGINLSRIESRPTKRLLGEYLFFIDLEGSRADPALDAALAKLQTHVSELKIFGSYETLSVSFVAAGDTTAGDRAKILPD